jgi:hypothetical protein
MFSSRFVILEEQDAGLGLVATGVHFPTGKITLFWINTGAVMHFEGVEDMHRVCSALDSKLRIWWLDEVTQAQHAN